MAQTGYIGRKMRLHDLKEKPVIIIAAFGSSRRGKIAFDLLDNAAKEAFSDYQIRWAFTSSIIRKKTGAVSLHQCLADAESEGYRQAVVLPLQVFPGTEYTEVMETAQYFPGMRVILGETLLHRWQYVEELLGILETDFLSYQEGYNILALHGTPFTADPATTAYLGFDAMIRERYMNTTCASLEGVPDFHSVHERLKREKTSEKFNRVRIIPVMYLAGMHVEDDLMGENGSWRSSLEKVGFSVECLSIDYQGERFYKSLAFTDKVVGLFVERIQRALDLLKYY